MGALVYLAILWGPNIVGISRARLSGVFLVGKNPKVPRAYAQAHPGIAYPTDEKRSSIPDY